MDICTLALPGLEPKSVQVPRPFKLRKITSLRLLLRGPYRNCWCFFGKKLVAVSFLK